ncbi:MAG TPA: hypothetical protein VNT60_02165 [Deinococcales bacterium]|nr:hypothetical protein [Deinococcales bacterium]
MARLDAVSVNHRVAAYLASYFDVIYAVNRVPHPGEKRLLSLTERLCPLRPASMRADVERLVAAGPAEVLVALDAASDGLDVLLALEGLLA